MQIYDTNLKEVKDCRLKLKIKKLGNYNIMDVDTT